MTDKFRRLTTVLERPLTRGGRTLVLLAALALVPTFLVPLWHMHFLAQQYPEGLDLYIYSHDLVGGMTATISTRSTS